MDKQLTYINDILNLNKNPETIVYAQKAIELTQELYHCRELYNVSNNQELAHMWYLHFEQGTSSHEKQEFQIIWSDQALSRKEKIDTCYEVVDNNSNTQVG